MKWGSSSGLREVVVMVGAVWLIWNGTDVRLTVVADVSRGCCCSSDSKGRGHRDFLLSPRTAALKQGKHDHGTLRLTIPLDEMSG